MLFIKECGETMNQTINRFKLLYDIKNKVCYAGRLDPMARGNVILLTGDECKEMNKYNNLKKTYIFEMVMGISSDTDDTMGIIENTTYFINKSDEIKKHISICSFEQNFHKFSSKKINGKSLWYYSMNNINIDIPTHNVSIYDIEYFDMKIYNTDIWKEYNIINMNKLSQTFRQDIIIESYKNINCDNIITLPIKITVSSGFYIRQLVRDIMNIINYPLMAFDINRINFIIN